jgi:hypothetical protein
VPPGTVLDLPAPLAKELDENRYADIETTTRSPRERAVREPRRR